MAYTILFAEDENAHHKLAKLGAMNVAKKTDCEINILHALNGGEGIKAYELAKAERRTIDLVITDFHMPIKNGFDFVAAIRAYNKDVPIVMLSSMPPTLPKELNVRMEDFKAGELAKFEGLILEYVRMKYQQ